MVILHINTTSDTNTVNALSRVTSGGPFKFIILGILGPNKSASSNPTESPFNDSPRAILTDVVDFPTPPLPDATAITCLTPGIGSLGGSPLEARGRNGPSFGSDLGFASGGGRFCLVLLNCLEVYIIYSI